MKWLEPGCSAKGRAHSQPSSLYWITWIWVYIPSVQKGNIYFLKCAYTFISLTALHKALRGLGRDESSYFNIVPTQGLTKAHCRCSLGLPHRSWDHCISKIISFEEQRGGKSPSKVRTALLLFPCLRLYIEKRFNGGQHRWWPPASRTTI